jgi:tetratricopeptide (TPR) repeat protein
MRIVVSIILVLQVGFSWASKPHYDSLYTLGNDAYIRQAYDTALMHYGAILESGFESPDLYYNMGNAHYKMSNIPNAILYFEKAITLNPSNEDYSYNLTLANKQIVDEIQPLPTPFYTQWWNTLIHATSSFTWAILTIVSVILLVVNVLLYRFSRTSQNKRIAFFLTLVFVSTSGLFYSFGRSQYHQKEKNNFSIVFAERATIFNEPNLNSTTLFIVHQGLKLKILEQEHNWYQIQLPDGSSGWIPSEEVELI